MSQRSPSLFRFKSILQSPSLWVGVVLLLTFGAGAGWAGLNSRQADPRPSTEDSTSEPTQADTLVAEVDPPDQISTAAGRRLLQAQAFLETRQERQALTALEGLTDQIPVLADQILMMRAIAYERLLSPVSAQQTWEALLQQTPDSTLVPRALLGLQRIDELRRRFPDHPVTAQALQEQLSREPDNVDLVRELVSHHSHSPGVVAGLDRWLQAEAGQLTAAEWQQVADGYWNGREYGKASRAYDRAPVTPRNLYRHGRSHHISGENALAREAYQTLLSQFPDSDEVPLTRRRLAAISDPATAIQLLKPLAAQEHEETPAALASLIRLYQDSASPQSAQATREDLWTRFPDSDAAAQDAWQIAWSRANAGDLQSAIQIAQRVGFGQEDSEIGAQLGYWSGKWQDQIGEADTARQTYTRVLEQFPHTYYAWRSALQLGLEVGDFTLGRLPVQVLFAPARLPLPGVSPQIQALHRLGVATAAWQRWQWETNIHAEELTPEQQFVTGVLRNAAGDHLQGINQVAYLRFDPDSRIDPLRERSDFWQTIYPLHFHDNANNQVGGDPSSQQGLAEWAKTFNLNPLMMAALIRQESRFEEAIVSRSGALGLMQVMPSTGAWIAQQLGLRQYELTDPADNLYLGAWYLDYTHRTYQDNSVLAVASYNGGPGNVAKWLNQFGFSDPDTFIEQIPFPETRGYVKSVFGNHWNYWQLYTSEGQALANRLAQP